MSNLKFVIGMLSGAAVGFAVASIYTKHRYESIIDEEVESVKEAYANLYSQPLEEGEVIVPEHVVNVDKGDISDYLELAKKYRQEDEAEENDQTEPEMEVVKVERPKNPKVYEITEAEYGELDEFDTIECTLFSDGVLADDDDGIIDDADDVVGDFNLEEVNEDNPLVYIRNEIKMIDYAIAYDTREYVKAMQSAHRIH